MLKLYCLFIIIYLSPYRCTTTVENNKTYRWYSAETSDSFVEGEHNVKAVSEILIHSFAYLLVTMERKYIWCEYKPGDTLFP